MASRLCSGDRLPSVTTLGRISTAFGVELKHLHTIYDNGPDAFASFLTKTVEQYEAKLLAQQTAVGTQVETSA